MLSIADDIPAMQGTYGELELFHVKREDVAIAWANGAQNLALACERCDDMTVDELRNRLTAGKYELIGLGHHGKPVAWAAISVNRQVLFVHAIYAPGASVAQSFRQLREYAKYNGCSSIRGACDEAVARLWVRKFNAKPIKQIMEIAV